MTIWSILSSSVGELGAHILYVTKGEYFYKENLILSMGSFFSSFWVLILPSIPEMNGPVRKINTLNGAPSFYRKFSRMVMKSPNMNEQQGLSCSGPAGLLRAGTVSRQLLPRRHSGGTEAETGHMGSCPGAPGFGQHFVALAEQVGLPDPVCMGGFGEAGTRAVHRAATCNCSSWNKGKRGPRY